MKNRLYIVALTLALAPGIALAQNQNYPSDRQNDQGMQRQDRDDQQRMNREDQQRMDQDDRGSRREAGNLDRMLRERYPNSNIAANYQDNNTVVLTGTAATGHDRKDAEDFVRSQLGNARVIDQIQVTGYGRGSYPSGAYNPNGTYDRDHDSGYNRENNADRDRDSGYNQQAPDRDRADRDQDNRVPQSDVDANHGDRDRDYAKGKDKDNHKDKDKKNKKDKDKDKNNDRDRTPDRDEQPH